MVNYEDFFSSYDFDALEMQDANEELVREDIVTPLLKLLGYKESGNSQIIRNKNLSDPSLRIGSGSSSKVIRIIPDYLLQVDGDFAWVLDAKAPKENIDNGDNVDQVFFYAIHSEIKVQYFALCNGKRFALFNVAERSKPILSFYIKDINDHWNDLVGFLAPAIFSKDSTPKPQITKQSSKADNFDYLACTPPKSLTVHKQEAQRHFGVHGYFTKQAWNVVQEYIRTFTKEGDTVFDPFCGSGVTPIEAFYIGRKGIGIDINPLAVFMSKTLALPVDLNSLESDYKAVVRGYARNAPKDELGVRRILSKHNYPSNIKLPPGSDVDSIEELFTDEQLAQLSVLKGQIKKIKNLNNRESLLLAFSSTLTKVNRTYHPSTSRGNNAGDCAVFKYSRHRVAKNEVLLNPLETFEEKYSRLVRAKKEMQLPKYDVSSNFHVSKGDATNLSGIDDESVDYIYTDPPYGSKIAYLDLSVMWNSWLDFKTTKDDYDAEVIEGGSKNKTTDVYSDLLAKSIKEMYRVLKYDRWMSFVFAHKEPKYWDMIINAAQDAGFEYVCSTKQASSQSSFKKRQNPSTVLEGQLIVNFRKVANPAIIQKIGMGEDVYKIVINIIETAIADNHGATIEDINSAIVIDGLEKGYLHKLHKKFDLGNILQHNFEYSEPEGKYFLKSQKGFSSHIPLDKRINYLLTSYLNGKRLEGIDPTTDDIILDIMPLLKNGNTPENQTIIDSLKELAEPRGQDCWSIKTHKQGKLF